ncbi:uncharacterized protein [Cicer arietinum]|uniref:uncharacterized protein n=1 Tax=Cicer arietinum TaxID=3827 RepID=UPI0006417A39
MGAPYFGVSGTSSVYNPKTFKGQSSSSHIYVEEGDSTNKIIVGWHVSPELYNNDATHIYSYWTVRKGGQVGLGGQTATHVGAPSPSMGLGDYSDDNFSHTCYFRNVAFQNASRHFYGPPEYLVEKFSYVPNNCYQIGFNDNFPSPIGYALQFGGPGGNCDN